MPTLLDRVFDIGVVGEGEQTLLELMQLYGNDGVFHKRNLKNVRGIVYHDKDELVLTSQTKFLYRQESSLTWSHILKKNMFLGGLLVEVRS